MFSSEKLSEVIAAYKEYFPVYWKDEKFKWEAIRHFQDHWDIKAENFLEMFMSATEKAYSLLSSLHYYPRDMIKTFAEVDPETVRGMFINLYDESKNLVERIESFISTAEELRIKYDDSNWKQHFQNLNSVSTYLWLEYPDKYYIYKYSEVKAVSKALDCFIKR